MRRVSVAAVAGLLAGLVAAPAVADPVPTSQAAQTITDACAASRAALLAGGSLTTSTSRLFVTPDRFEVGAESPELVVVAAAGTYGSIASSRLRARDQKRALGYLRRPAASWWVNAGKFETPEQGWSATFEQARDAVLMVDESCSSLLQEVFQAVDQTGNRWTFTLASQGQVAIVIDEGRFSQMADIAFDYSVPDVALPAGAVSLRAWQKASQAASLNWTLRSLTGQVAKDVNAGGPTVSAIENAVRAAIPVERVVPIKVRQLRKGSLVYARNPYTKAYHAWRVYLKGGRALARRVAP